MIDPTSAETDRLRSHIDTVRAGNATFAFQYVTTDAAKVVRPPDIDAPDIWEVLPQELMEDFERIRPVVTAGGWSRAIWVGPEFPDEAIVVLREAYTEMTSDPEVFEEFEVALGNVAGTEYSVEQTAIPGEETAQIYEEATQVYLENLDYLEELQQRYWEEHWQ